MTTPPFILTAITSDPERARAADAAGVDWVGLDVERVGKADRQGHIPDARISEHTLDDLGGIAAALRKAKLFVRVNPIRPGSEVEIARAIDLGASVLMLPYFKTAAEVARFVALVNGRAAMVLLLETAPAAMRLHEVISACDGAYIMVGLNDLHQSLGLGNPFEVIGSDLFASIATQVRAAGLHFGFGGLARVDDDSLPVPPDLVFAQYARVGARAAWLSRSFFHAPHPIDVAREVARLRERLDFWFAQSQSVLLEKRDELRRVTQRLAEGA